MNSVLRTGQCILFRTYSTVVRDSKSLTDEKLQAMMRHAIAWGEEEEVKFCIKNGAPINRKDVNANDGHNDYPIVRASYMQHMNIVKMLLGANADPDVSCEHGHTPLMILSERGNVELVKVLLDAKANVHKVDAEGLNAILTACHRAYNFAEIIDLLLQAGADINHTCNNGNNGLMHLLENIIIGWHFKLDHEKLANFKTVEKVIQLCDVNKGNKKGLTPLMVTLSKGYLSFVELLLKKGADRLVRNKEGQNSIDIAEVKEQSCKAKLQNYEEMMSFISDAANKECKKVEGIRSGEAVNVLTDAIYTNKTEKVAKLLSQGVDPNQDNELKQSPMQFAIRGGNPEIVKLLLDAHADVHVKSRFGWDSRQHVEHYLEQATKNAMDATAALNQLKMHD